MDGAASRGISAWVASPNPLDLARVWAECADALSGAALSWSARSMRWSCFRSRSSTAAESRSSAEHGSFAPATHSRPATFAGFGIFWLSYYLLGKDFIAVPPAGIPRAVGQFLWMRAGPGRVHKRSHHGTHPRAVRDVVAGGAGVSGGRRGHGLINQRLRKQQGEIDA